MTDNKLLLLSFVLYWMTLVFLFIKSKYNKSLLITNLTIHVIYSSYFLYGLFYKSEGNGTSLAWWFFLLLALWTHWLINLGQIIYLLVKTHRQKQK
jgi:hypothetical protein